MHTIRRTNTDLDGGDVVDDGTAHRRYDASSTRAYLIRPDGHIATRADARHLDAVVDLLRAHLRPRALPIGVPTTTTAAATAASARPERTLP